MKLDGKVALVTGGNSGIGLAAAKLFKAEGAKVIITARSEETFKKAQSEFGSQFDVIKTDVSDVGQIAALYSQIKSKYGGLDVVFANAGVAIFKPTTEVDQAFFDNQFNTNVRGVYFTVAHAIPLMRKGGSVILTSSAVSGKGIAGASVYSATKSAIRSFARTWTAEIPVGDVRFNILSPGAIETPIYGKMGMSSQEVAGFGDYMKSIIPAKRFGSSEEMAKVALFLASSESSYIAGADIVADGGFAQV